MVGYVYIGYAHTIFFEYEIAGPTSDSKPEHAMPNPEKDTIHCWLGSDIYWAIWKHPQSKIVAWECSAVKMYKAKIIDFLNQYHETGLAARAKEYLHNDVEYVLVAMEGISFSD